MTKSKKIVQSIRQITQLLQDGGKKTHQRGLPILNGLIGDQLPPNGLLAIGMHFRQDGQDVEVDALKISPKPHPVSIFLHGLMMDESCWMGEDSKRPDYGTLLRRDLGHTVLYLRYNTGLHISQNGRALANLLQQFYECHGEKMSCLNLVGHSMGGLVIRSAGYYGTQEKHQWMKKLRQVVLLGSPQAGSHWEQLGHLTSSILKKIWSLHTRLLGKIADRRSNGIKDLRWGFMLDEDWQHPNADDLLFRKPKPPPPLPGVQYHVLAGNLFEDETSLFARYFGDGLVSQHSATRETLGTFKLFPKTGHLRLLKSPEVGAYLKECLQ